MGKQSPGGGGTGQATLVGWGDDQDWGLWKPGLRVEGIEAQGECGVRLCCTRELGYAREKVAEDRSRAFWAGVPMLEKV